MRLFDKRAEKNDSCWKEGTESLKTKTDSPANLPANHCLILMHDKSDDENNSFEKGKSDLN